ncbi:MAG: hypothetical protein JSU59_02030, partial [Nitrospirota bacterium]
RPLQGSSVTLSHTVKSQKPISNKRFEGTKQTIPSTIGSKENRLKAKSATPPAAVESPNREIQPESPKTGDLDWESVMNRLIERHPNIGSFVEMGTLVNVESDHVVIGYPKSASVARWRTDKPENRMLIGKICEEVAGRPLHVRVIELNDAQTAGPTIGQLRVKRKEKQDQDLLDEVRAHPLVKQALELFGGNVVSARRVPPKEETS